MKLKQMVGHDEIMKFVAGLYNGDLHAKRVLSLANATLGVLASASLAVLRLARDWPRRWAR